MTILSYATYLLKKERFSISYARIYDALENDFNENEKELYFYLYLLELIAKK
ncbi:MAG: hypothetical protein HRT40_04980 [Campylobacteraceae bacterium]|nr:hypothetical protein [Campylobacteraceae bacterium]